MYINIAKHKKLRVYQKFLKQNLAHLSYAFTDLQSLKNKSFEPDKSVFQKDIYSIQKGDIQNIDDYATCLNLNPNEICDTRYSTLPSKCSKLGSPFMLNKRIYRDNSTDVIRQRNYTCIDNRILNPVGMYVFTLLTDDDFIEHQLEKYWYALQEPTGLALNRMLNYHVSSLTILVTEKTLDALINHTSTTLQIEKLIINKAYIEDVNENSESSIMNISKFKNTTANYDKANAYGIIQCREHTLDRIATAYRKFNPKIINTIFLPYHEKIITYHVYCNHQYDTEWYRTSFRPFNDRSKTIQNPVNNYTVYIVEKSEELNNDYLDQIADLMHTVNNQLTRYLYSHCKITINEKQQLTLITNKDNPLVNKIIHKINKYPNLLLDKVDIPSILIKTNLVKSCNRSAIGNPVDLDLAPLSEINSLNNIIHIKTANYFHSNCRQFDTTAFILNQKVRNLLFARSNDFVERLPVKPIKSITGQKPADNDYWTPLIKNQDTLFAFIASLRNADQPTLYKTNHNMYITNRNSSATHIKLLKYPR